MARPGRWLLFGLRLGSHRAAAPLDIALSGDRPARDRFHLGDRLVNGVPGVSLGSNYCPEGGPVRPDLGGSFLCASYIMLRRAADCEFIFASPARLPWHRFARDTGRSGAKYTARVQVAIDICGEFLWGPCSQGLAHEGFRLPRRASGLAVFWFRAVVGCSRGADYTVGVSDQRVAGKLIDWRSK